MTDIVPTWPAFKKWTRDFFNKTYGDQRVVMKAVDVSHPFFNYVYIERERGRERENK